MKFTPTDQIEARFQKAQTQVDQLAPSLPPSLGYGGTGLARAWTPSLPARSVCALSLCESLFTRSQRVQIAGHLVPKDPTDEPAARLLKRIKAKETSRAT